jgi:hypothetical protein
MVILAEWTKMHTVGVVLAVIILIVLIVLMSTRKPGPESPSQQVGFADQPDEEGAEVERPDADEAEQ